MERACQEDRILLTEDKDFGWLSFIAHLDNPGVVLIRFPAPARRMLPSAAMRLVAEFGPRLKGAFVVLSPGSVRISAVPAIE